MLEGREPNVLGDLLDTDVLSGEEDTQADLGATDADPTTAGDGDDSVVDGVFQQPGL